MSRENENRQLQSQHEMNEVRTDIALLGKDIKHIRQSFDNMEKLATKINDIDKVMATNHNINEANDKRISLLERSFVEHRRNDDDFRKEMNQKFNELEDKTRKEREDKHEEIIKKLDNLDKNFDERVRRLENWRWYIMGIGGILLLIIIEFPWSSLL